MRRHRSLAVESVTVAVRSDSEIETAITALGREQAGLVLMDDAFYGGSLPSGYFLDRGQQGAVDFHGARFARDGGLMSYPILRISSVAPQATSIAS